MIMDLQFPKSGNRAHILPGATKIREKKMASIDVSTINNMSEDLDYAEIGAAILIITKLLQGMSVSIDAAHKVVGVSRKEWITISERVLTYFNISESGKIYVSSHARAEEEENSSIEAVTQSHTVETPKPSSTSLPRAGQTLELPFVTKSQRSAPQCPRFAEHKAPAPLKSTKAHSIDSAVARLVTEGMTPAKARAAIMGIFQKYRDEAVISAISVAERCDPVALISYLHGVLKNSNQSFNGPGITAPSKPRPAATPKNLGISEGLSDLISERNRTLRMNLED